MSSAEIGVWLIVATPLPTPPVLYGWFGTPTPGVSSWKFAGLLSPTRRLIGMDTPLLPFLVVFSGGIHVHQELH